MADKHLEAQLVAQNDAEMICVETCSQDKEKRPALPTHIAAGDARAKRPRSIVTLSDACFPLSRN